MTIVRLLKPERHGEASALPSSYTARWVAKRKAAVVLAVRREAITRKHARERYRLSPEELASWEAAFARYGTAGLRASWRGSMLPPQRSRIRVRQRQTPPSGADRASVQSKGSSK
jgi:hypothetical protein